MVWETPGEREREIAVFIDYYIREVVIRRNPGTIDANT
jgi:hypothetical protein